MQVITMCIYEEVNIRLKNIQNGMDTVHAAGVDLKKGPTKKRSKRKFRIMYATIYCL